MTAYEYFAHDRYKAAIRNKAEALWELELYRRETLRITMRGGRDLKPREISLLEAEVARAQVEIDSWEARLAKP